MTMSIPNRLLQKLQGAFILRRYPGLVIVLPEDRVLYYSIPKVACSSVMSACVDALGLPFPEDEWKPEVFQTHHWDHLYDRHAIVIEGSRKLSHQDFWSFAFVRNPWDRLVSCFAEKIRDDGDGDNFVDGVSKILEPFGVFKRGMTFNSFAKAVCDIPDSEAEPHFMSQHVFVTDTAGTLLPDYVGRFENMAEDFETVRSRLHRPVNLPHLLRSSRGEYRNYYDATLRDLVGRRYAEDVALFGYAF